MNTNLRSFNRTDEMCYQGIEQLDAITAPQIADIDIYADRVGAIGERGGAFSEVGDLLVGGEDGTIYVHVRAACGGWSALRPFPDADTAIKFAEWLLAAPDRVITQSFLKGIDFLIQED